MKRFLSLFIALILVFSMFAVTAVAFAEDQASNCLDSKRRANLDEETTATHEVKFDETMFKKYVVAQQSTNIEMSKTFMFDGKYTEGDGDDAKTVVWFEDYDILHAIFPGINYIELKDEDFDEEDKDNLYTLTYDLQMSDKEGEELSLHPTQKVKLNKAPKNEGYLFAGWTVKFDEKDGVTIPKEFNDTNRFPEEFQFNMLETDVTVTANWIKILEKDEEGEQEKVPDMYANDLIYVLYNSSDSRNDMEDWSECPVTGSFTVTTEVTWAFRFAVVDGIKFKAEGSTYDWKLVLVTTYQNMLDKIKEIESSGQELTEEEQKKLRKEHDCTLYLVPRDTTHPVIELSDTMTKKEEEGLTVGVNYSISTSLDIEDASSTTVTYKVYKKVGNDVEGAEDGWLLIFDSKTKEVTEGYDKNISTSGVITPLEEDVTGEYVYKIVYSVVDAAGFYGVNKDGKFNLEYHPTMLLKVNMPVTDPGKISALDVWKIILYVIAGLSAAGIVVLLCIKPKQATAADTRYNPNANDDTDGNGKQE